ncbi:hypothetical protein M045_gp51 [Mycobacterium phage HINdeR]|uniref:Uncharacterized protein n=1 Tax=Mycobacterium phage HINdeR TaxID=1327770 RepID=R4JLI9_9CAUD|nr:hypothetical protein M045_gp51 [Mycobacterium phage HINdeR]AGK87530.1 hypothetical protein PBI_HINDER_51 [Mycobacterium phage HINdeR]
MSFKVGDVVVVGEQPTIQGDPHSVFLTPGEVGDVIEHEEPSEPGSVRVKGRHSGLPQWVDVSCLTPFNRIADDPNIEWVDGIHDYVHEEDNDA